MTAVSVQKRPNFLMWSEIEKWTSTSSLLRFGELPDDWQMRFVHEFATQIDHKVSVEPENEYKMAGVRWYGEGVFHRETVLGKEQSANYLSPLKIGAFIYNRLFAWKESFAVITPEFEGLYVSNEFPQFEIDETIALPKYVYLLFNSRKIIRAVNSTSIGSSAVSRNRFKESDFLGFRVPIPPIPVQQKIVAHWEKETQKIDDELCALEQAESQVTLNILSGAGIKINLGKQLLPVLRKRFSDFERWGVGFNRYSWKLSNLITSSSFNCSPLSHFAWINPGINLNLGDSDLVSFIPMEAVDDKDGIVSAAKTKKLIQVKSGYTRFMEGDVLWAKITPCMQNGKSAVVQDLMNGVGFGSTEFHVLRSKNKDFLRNEFIHLILRLPEIRRAAMRYFVGSAGQQRVPKEFLEDLHFPIPPINLQFQLIKKMDIEKKSIRKMRASILKSKINLGVITEKLILGTLSVEDL